MDVITLLDDGLAWTSERFATVRPEHLDAPTPCEGWNLQELLDHATRALTRFTEAAAGGPAEEPAQDFPALAAWAMSVWRTPGVMEQTCMIGLGPTPAPVVARLCLLESVLHGWDASQATGEAAEIPAGLAVPILDFARVKLAGDRGGYFGPDLEVGDTPSERLVAYLGRKP